MVKKWGTYAEAKKKKLGVGPYMENLLECLNYLLASAHPSPPPDILIYLDEAIIYYGVQRKL